MYGTFPLREEGLTQDPGLANLDPCSSLGEYYERFSEVRNLSPILASLILAHNFYNDLTLFSYVSKPFDCYVGA